MMKIVSFLGINHKSCVNEKWNTQKHFFVHVPEKYRKFCSFSWVLRKWYVFMRSKYLDSNIFMQITMLIDFQHIKCFSVGKILSETCSQAISCCPHWIKLDYSDSIKTSKGKTKLDYFLQFDLVFFILSRFLLEYKRYEKIVKNVITCRTICCY